MPAAIELPSRLRTRSSSSTSTLTKRVNARNRGARQAATRGIDNGGRHEVRRSEPPKRQGMYGPKRVIGKSLGSFSALIVSGCICLGVQPLQYLGSLFDGLDLAQIETIAKLTFDVNDFSQGNITTDDLTQRYKRFGRSMEIRPVDSVQMTYLFMIDHALRQQTIVLPGTINDANLASDLDLVLALDEKLSIGVHRGFQLNAQAVYNDLKDSLF